MIQPQTMLNVADNSGAKLIQCFRVLGGSNKKYAQIGDIIMATVKVAEPRKLVKKHDKVKAVIVRQRKPFRRKDGSYIRFDDNAAVIWKKIRIQKVVEFLDQLPEKLKKKDLIKLQI